jgi:hypothetical protein
MAVAEQALELDEHGPATPAANDVTTGMPGRAVSSIR